MSRALDLAISYTKPEVDSNLKIYTPTGSVAHFLAQQYLLVG